MNDYKSVYVNKTSCYGIENLSENGLYVAVNCILGYKNVPLESEVLEEKSKWTGNVWDIYKSTDSETIYIRKDGRVLLFDGWYKYTITSQRNYLKDYAVRLIREWLKINRDSTKLPLPLERKFNVVLMTLNANLARQYDGLDKALNILISDDKTVVVPVIKIDINNVYVEDQVTGKLRKLVTK